MKNVTTNPPTETVSLSEIDGGHKYYGALLPRDGDPVKGYFRAQRYGENYNLFSVKGFNDGNAFGYGASTLEESIAKVLAREEQRVYEFDSLTELFTWMEKE